MASQERYRSERQRTDRFLNWMQIFPPDIQEELIISREVIARLNGSLISEFHKQKTIYWYKLSRDLTNSFNRSKK